MATNIDILKTIKQNTIDNVLVWNSYIPNKNNNVVVGEFHDATPIYNNEDSTYYSYIKLDYQNIIRNTFKARITSSGNYNALIKQENENLLIEQTTPANQIFGATTVTVVGAYLNIEKGEIQLKWNKSANCNLPPELPTIECTNEDPKTQVKQGIYSDYSYKKTDSQFGDLSTIYYAGNTTWSSNYEAILEITSGSTVNDSVSITLDDELYTIPILNNGGDILETTRQIFNGFASTSWVATKRNTKIYFQSLTFKENYGLFSFSAGMTGAAGTIDTNNIGALNWGLALINSPRNAQSSIKYKKLISFRNNKEPDWTIEPAEGTVEFKEFNYLWSAVEVQVTSYMAEIMSSPAVLLPTPLAMPMKSKIVKPSNFRNRHLYSTNKINIKSDNETLNEFTAIIINPES